MYELLEIVKVMTLQKLKIIEQYLRSPHLFLPSIMLTSIEKNITTKFPMLCFIVDLVYLNSLGFWFLEFQQKQLKKPLS